MEPHDVKVNITKDQIVGPCFEKCYYNFKYEDSVLVAKNNEIMISLKYDNGHVPPVLYNSQKYNVSNINIACPSIHKFDGQNVAAEIFIEHLPVFGGPNLYVAIPIVSSGNTSTSASLLNNVLEIVAANAPKKDETSTINISDFTLQNIVPNKPFYSYTDLQDEEWIVFGLSDAIPLGTSILTKLSQIIKPYIYNAVSKSGIYYNEKGPNVGNVEDGIYISCKPTGNSEEEIDVVKDKNQTTYDWSNALNNPTTLLAFQVLAGFIILVLFFILVNFLYTKVTGKKDLTDSIPGLSSTDA